MGDYYFAFRDPEGGTLVISHSFPDRAELEKCLAGVRDTAMIAEVCGQHDPCPPPPLFKLEKRTDGVTFSLIGYSGEVIFSSVPYTDETLCGEAISVLKSLSRGASVSDLTVD